MNTIHELVIANGAMQASHRVSPHTNNTRAPVGTHDRSQPSAVGREAPRSSATHGSDRGPPIEAVLESANLALQASATNLSFKVDEASGSTVISIVDTKTGETLKEIPSQHARELAARIQESLNGHSDAAGLLLAEQA